MVTPNIGLEATQWVWQLDLPKACESELRKYGSSEECFGIDGELRVFFESMKAVQCHFVEVVGECGAADDSLADQPRVSGLSPS